MRRFIFAFFMMVLAAVASAVPAKRGLFSILQADGSSVRVRLVGDEYHHYYLSEDGYLLVEEDGVFYYGDADAEGRIIRSDHRLDRFGENKNEFQAYLDGIDRKGSISRVARFSQRARENALVSSMRNKATRTAVGDKPASLPGLIPGFDFPTDGEQKAIVILVEFADLHMKTADAHDYFSRMLNEQGFSLWGGTGSARDYFIESSNGRFIPTFDVYGPVTLSKNYSYYGKNGADGNDLRPHEMVIEAVKLIDPEVDFSEYDRDGDGFVDNVFIFYAGKGEASGGGADTIWPHSWDITSAGGKAYFHDGVRVDRYGCSNEWEGNRPDGVGTFIHEFSHVIGLPDLYSTVDNSAFTPGEWSVLDYGSYCNNSRTPPLYSSFERAALGWLQPFDMTESADVELRPLHVENRAAIVRTGNENEYFLFENRQQSGWDKYLPGHGMLVWHVDFDEDAWLENVVNNNIGHQRVDLIEADNIRSNKTFDGDPFPGSKNVVAFSSETFPAFKTVSGESLGVSLSDIREEGETVFFRFNNDSGATAEAMEMPDAVCRVENGNIIVEGLDEGTEVTAFDVAGCRVGRGIADIGGTVSIQCGSKGMVIVKAGTVATYKILMK